MKLFLKNRKRLIAVTIFVAILMLNIVSYLHAYKFTHFVTGGPKTEKPESLSFIKKISVLITGVNVPKKLNTKTPAHYGYEFKSLTIEGSDGLKTPVWEISPHKSTYTVILFHGYSSKKEDLLPLGLYFVDKSADVILVDFPGHGDSPYDWSTLGYREAQVVTSVFRHYQAQGKKNIILHGLSLGASSIITAIHTDKIQPKALILEMPFGSLYQTVQSRFELMGFPVTFPFAELLVFWGGVQNGYNAFDLNPVDFAGDINVPTLLLGGAGDQRASKSVLQDIYTNLQGHKELHLFEGLGHVNLFVRGKNKYEEIVDNFMKDMDSKANSLI
ncbi:MAG: alpha/beta hydrolase [Deltaproteobacteria bacterium]|nr:alpha/beta hydrolase [Deltaproteobacteria bacterium]